MKSILVFLFLCLLAACGTTTHKAFDDTMNQNRSQRITKAMVLKKHGRPIHIRKTHLVDGSIRETWMYEVMGFVISDYVFFNFKDDVLVGGTESNF